MKKTEAAAACQLRRQILPTPVWKTMIDRNTGLTAWLERSWMADNAFPAALASGDAWRRIPLPLLRQLEASLCHGHSALLALDLGGIERETREQVGLSRKIAGEIRRGTESTASVWETEVETRASASAERAPEMPEELARVISRVLQALRLQTALLARARGKLRVLANMLADPSVTYGPLPARTDDRAQAFDCHRGGEI
jgi:hypothetical protein